MCDLSYVNRLIKNQTMERELTAKAEAAVELESTSLALAYVSSFRAAPVGARGKFLVDEHNSKHGECESLPTAAAAAASLDAATGAFSKLRAPIADSPHG